MPRNFPVNISFKGLDRITSVMNKITSKFPKLSKAASRTATAFKVINSRMAKFRKTMNKLGGKMKDIGKSLTIGLTLPLLLFGGTSIKAFAKFEQGVVDVVKTTGLGFSQVENIIDDLTKKLPIPEKALLEIAGAAGQLGVKGVANIKLFTDSFAKLEKSSDIIGEDGAKAVVRLLTVTGDGVGKVKEFSSAIVDLGNNSAASESEILAVATRVGLATAQFKIGSANTLGIAAAMKSLGINAEGGGTVIGKTFRKIQEAVDMGGKSFTVLEKITGLTGDTLKKKFKDDATGVFKSFIGGLARLGEKGISTSKALSIFGLTGDRISAVIPVLAQRSDVLTASLDRATTAFRENVALEKEFAEQSKTLNSLMTKFSNSFVKVKRTVGKLLMPAFTFLVEKLKQIFDWFVDLSPVTQKIILVFAAMAAAIGPLILGVGVFLTMLPAMVAGFVLLTTASLPVTLTVLAIAAGIGVLVAAITLLIVKWDWVKNKFLAGWNFIKSGFVAAADWISNKMSNLMDSILTMVVKGVFKISQAIASIADYLPFGGSIANFLGMGGGSQTMPRQAGAATGAPSGAMGIQAAAAQNINRTNNARVDVNFSNLPENARVETNSGNGPLRVSQGLSGMW